PPAGFQLVTVGTAEFRDPPADLKMRDLIVTPGEGIGPVKFGMSHNEVEKLLGKPELEEVSKSGSSSSMVYVSRGFGIRVSKDFGVMGLTCMAQKGSATRIRDFSGKTDKGIALGANAAAIIRAYGTPDSNESKLGSTYLTYKNMSFTLFGDQLVMMWFDRPAPNEP